MWDEDVLANFSAAAETVLPGSTDGKVHERVAALIDGMIPGYAILVSGLLDAFANDAVPGSRFADLTNDNRIRVLKTMAAEESVDIRDVVDGIALFTLGQNYAETHPDHEAIWRRIGYHGPSEGVPDYA